MQRGGRLLAAILRRLSADLTTHTSGFPDIALWRVQPEQDGCKCCFTPSAPQLRELLRRRGGAGSTVGGGEGGGGVAPSAGGEGGGFTAQNPAFALVEVKSASDRLHLSQFLWFAGMKGQANMLILKVLGGKK